MKHNMKFIWSYMPWLLLLLGLDAFAALLLWLADIQAFFSLIIIIILTTIVLFSVLCYILVRLERKKEQIFLEFLENPDEYHKESLWKTVSLAQREAVYMLAKTLNNKQNAYTRLQEQVNDYEEYIESWAHEIKTPLSLLTLLLDNRREELSAAVSFRLDYIRTHIQESVDQMLFYARLKGAKKDYLFEYLPIRICIEEVLEDYKPLLEEKQFQIQCCLSDDNTIYSDQRGVHFLLSQLISNTIKYCSREPKLCVESFERDNHYILSIKDNGIGVRSCDLPYIFEKGFTGDSGEGRKKATGMGLYLAKEMAEELNIALHVKSEWRKGFEIQIVFPIVNKE